MYLGKPKGATFRIISAALIFFFMSSFVMPKDALAARSRAGGGDVVEFSFSDFAATAGIGVGTAVIGVGIGSALGSGWQTLKSGADAASVVGSMGGALGGSFGNLSGLTSTMISGYNTFMAGTQVARAVGAAGTYHEWNPATTFIVSSIASGVAAGALNPAYSLGSAVPIIGGSGILEGAVVGGLAGLASGEVQVLVDRDRISEGKTPGAAAQIAGFTAGYLATNLGRGLVDARSYGLGPTGESHIAKSLIVTPLENTVNAWPMLATNALGTWAASRFDDTYASLVMTGINSIGGSALNAFADSYGLKFESGISDTAKELRKNKKSSWEIFEYEMGQKFNANSIKYMALTSLLSAGTSVATNALIGSGGKDIDTNTGTYKNPMRAMLLSMAGVMGTSIARGVALNIYSEKNAGQFAAQGIKAPADTATTIASSIGQGFTELGSQTLAMGLPFTNDTAAWVHYNQNLLYASRAAASRGFWPIMQNKVISTGKDIISRNISATVAETPLGGFMGMAPVIAVEGYKNQPFSLATLYMGPNDKLQPDFIPFSAKVDAHPINKEFGESIIKAKQSKGY
ncbi:hypothetical protein EPN54_04265 [bacterium]|nr:MAG: hypothetical protein EPN54_04265 [bacterium]